MTDEFSIVYCKLSDGSPCANWQWRGLTPQAVAVLERRGTRMSRIRTAKHGGIMLYRRRYTRTRSDNAREYQTWTAMLKAERAYIKAIVAEVMAS